MTNAVVKPLLPSASAGDSSSKQLTSSWHSLPLAEVLTQLHTTTAGLKAPEVTERRASYGSNSLQEAEQVSRWRVFGRQFTNVIVWVLIVAGGVSLAIGEWLDGGITAQLITGLIAPVIFCAVEERKWRRTRRSAPALVTTNQIPPSSS